MSHAYWYATRGSGVVALVLLTLVVAVGVAGSLRLRGDRWPRFLVLGLHRNATLLALVFLGVHVGTTLLDSYTPITVRDVFVPFLGRYRPLWLGLGAVAFDLLLALVVTSLLRARVGYRAWRALHWLAYAAWPVALVHGLGTGSDPRFGWLQAVTAACVLIVLAAVGFRLRTAAAPSGRRLLTGAAAAAAVVAGLAWYEQGPAARGWAARAGTPQTLLAARGARVAAPAVTATPAAQLPPPPFTGTLAGTLSSRADPGSGLVSIDIRVRTRGGANGLLWIRLRGAPLDGGGVSMTASGVAFGTRTVPNAYVGTITGLQGTDLALSLRDAAGKRLALRVRLSVDQSNGRVAGTLRALPGGGESE